MERYIKVSLLLQRLTGINSTVDQGIKYYNSVYNLIQEIPSADVEEVKHGEWKYECLECSICKRNISEICDADSYLTSGIEYKLLFCPFCGAKMNRDKNDFKE